MHSATAGMFEEVDRQLDELARVATAPVPDAPLPFIASPPKVPEVTILPPPPVDGRARRIAVTAAAVIAALGLVVIAAVNIAHLIRGPETLSGKAAVDSVVARILVAESHGATDLKNKRSSAAGPAQFLDDTWLELIRSYRPDLAKERTRDQLLALRSNPHLAHEIAVRFAQRNAALLRRRGLPVTAGTLYLAHFAGAAGAAALLKAPPHADAAGVMAMADARGKTSREKIVKANPFLDEFTVTDIKRWAERKMDGPTLVLSELLSANTKK
ncbi:MAG: lytic transglycosylase domain-containing protein [Pseudolabrys sp.]